MIQNKKCLLFKNAQVVSDGKVQSKDVVVFRDKFVKTPPKDCEIIEVDCEGRYLMPGFIDIHVHGGGNCDFMDGNPASVRTVALTHLAHGTTTMMPTLLTASHEEILAALAAYNAATEQDALLRSIFYGVHMEGPYLSKNQKGAQDESYIKDFTGREYEIYYHLCREIKRWSIAPEVKGLEEFEAFCEKNDIAISVAHTDAFGEEIIKRWTPQFKLFTHLYSGMQGVTRVNCYRHAGAVEAAYLLKDAYAEIIADGRHLPKELLLLVYQIKGPKKTVLITDAIRAAGTDLKYSFIGSKENGLPIVIENNIAYLQDKSSFAGSVATADLLVKNMVEAGIPLEDAVRMVTETPAKLFGMKKIGGIRFGYYADFVLADQNLNVRKVFKRGREIPGGKQE